MNYHRLKILIIILVSIIILVVAAFNIYNYIFWNKVSVINKNFITAWNSYDYNNYPDYPNRVKPYLAKSFYQDNFLGEENVQSNEILTGKLVAQEKAVTVSNIKIKNKSFKDDTYLITSTYAESVTINSEGNTDTKTITVTFHKSDDTFLVGSVSYE